ncbi:uncharacterized protein LOC126682957 [Mercurialis annua]|uniref:uncharacterized protein LOC126682957 n=1 Tax=Mercurialis annua TaxID=3986 RepID=UPI00215E1B18|nr:uncharacterized protein LOC126682957 [Mercurialis annua]
MAVKKKTMSLDATIKPNDDRVNAKRGLFRRCFSHVEIVKIEPGTKSLKELDSFKLKAEIRRWAKAVVAYARQVSNRFGNSRK